MVPDQADRLVDHLVRFLQALRNILRCGKMKRITGVEFARLLDVSRPTLYRYVREFEQ